MKWKLFIVLIILSLSLSASTVYADKSRVIVMGIDSTGSYDLWEEAKNLACSVVSQLKPGDIFYLRTITDKSFLDECSVFRLELPNIELPDTDNPFDRKARKQKRLILYQLNQIKSQAAAKIMKLNNVGAKYTDISGFLAAASDKFARYSKDRLPILIIASDLLDNIRYKPEINLYKAQVEIVCFEVFKDPQKTYNFMSKWRVSFKKMKANDTRFIRSDERFRLDSM